jgi:hypothetical protein
MPHHRHQRGRLHSTVNGGSSSRRNSSIGLPRADDCSDDTAAPTVDRPQLGRSAEASKPLLISRGTGSSNPFPSSGESDTNLFLRGAHAIPLETLTSREESSATADPTVGDWQIDKAGNLHITI